MPERYGPWKTVYNRFWRWSRNGTLTTLVSRVRVIAEAIDELDREVSVDSSIVRAHQHAPEPAAHPWPRPAQGADGSRGGHSEPADHAIGRSRGGPTTKIHLACDGHGRPLSVVLTGGNVNDCTQFITVIGHHRVHVARGEQAWHVDRRGSVLPQPERAEHLDERHRPGRPDRDRHPPAVAQEVVTRAPRRTT
ncbi:transposase [Lentzea sp. E54]|uniref:transposase n=1 Tax=Lentzea xerophila TaxID=3435883 RepID=UPI003DA61452